MYTMNKLYVLSLMQDNNINSGRGIYYGLF